MNIHENLEQYYNTANNNDIYNDYMRDRNLGRFDKPKKQLNEVQVNDLLNEINDAIIQDGITYPYYKEAVLKYYYKEELSLLKTDFYEMCYQYDTKNYTYEQYLENIKKLNEFNKTQESIIEKFVINSENDIKNIEQLENFIRW